MEKTISTTTAWIRFMAPVVPQTALALMQVIDQAVENKADHLHLMISSPGGSVFHGLSVHNYLRGLNIPVTTYNFGSVDSIGVILFCSGETRICVPHARFLIHGVTLSMQGPITLDQKTLDENLKSIKIDSENIAKVVSDTCGKTMESVEADMLERVTLNPSQAKDYGLVTKIDKALYPGGYVYAIYENGGVFQSSQGMDMMKNFTGMQLNSTLTGYTPLPLPAK